MKNVIVVILCIEEALGSLIVDVGWSWLDGHSDSLHLRREFSAAQCLTWESLGTLMQRLWVRWIALQVSFSSGPFSPQLCSALQFFQGSFAFFFSDNGLFCLTSILYPQGLLPGEPSKPFQSKWLGTRALHIWNWWFSRPCYKNHYFIGS